MEATGLEMLNKEEAACCGTERCEHAEKAHSETETQIATKGLGRFARLRVGAQIKVIEIAPVLAPFMEAQAACFCKAGCPSCAVPTVGVPVWETAKSWLGRRSNAAGGQPPLPPEQPADMSTIGNTALRELVTTAGPGSWTQGED